MCVDDPASFYAEARSQGCCAKCGSTGPWEAHHVVQEQRLRREGAPRHSPADALRLCAKRPDTCHERHTTHQDLVPLSCLSDENIAFAARWLGPGPAHNYLRRYYRGEDPRVDALLEQP